MIRAVLGLGLIVGAGLLLTRQGEQGGTTGGSPWIPLDTNFTDWLTLPEFGSSWDWTFSGGSQTTPTGGDMSQPRGIRNNNPGNIEHNGTNWQGMDNPPHDGRFIRFVTPQYGIRAMARVLTTTSGSMG